MVMMSAKMGEKDSRDDVLKAFQVFDSDETGAIDLRKLDRVAKATRYSRPNGLSFRSASPRIRP